jgi:hypothetical protein
MTFDDFNKTLSSAAPPDNIAGPLAGLWWAAKGDWDTSHKIVQDDAGREAAWVHAYLHRVEGDLPNASYWYRTAGKPVATGALDDEWSAITTELLEAARKP